MINGNMGVIEWSSGTFNLRKSGVNYKEFNCRRQLRLIKKISSETLNDVPLSYYQST